MKTLPLIKLPKNTCVYFFNPFFRIYFIRLNVQMFNGVSFPPAVIMIVFELENQTVKNIKYIEHFWYLQNDKLIPSPLTINREKLFNDYSLFGDINDIINNLNEIDWFIYLKYDPTLLKNVNYPKMFLSLNEWKTASNINKYFYLYETFPEIGIHEKVKEYTVPDNVGFKVYTNLLIDQFAQETRQTCIFSQEIMYMIGDKIIDLTSKEIHYIKDIEDNLIILDNDKKISPALVCHYNDMLFSVIQQMDLKTLFFKVKIDCSILQDADLYFTLNRVIKDIDNEYAIIDWDVSKFKPKKKLRKPVSNITEMHPIFIYDIFDKVIPFDTITDDIFLIQDDSTILHRIKNPFKNKFFIEVFDPTIKEYSGNYVLKDNLVNEIGVYRNKVMEILTIEYNDIKRGIPHTYTNRQDFLKLFEYFRENNKIEIFGIDYTRVIQIGETYLYTIYDEYYGQFVRVIDFYCDEQQTHISVKLETDSGEIIERILFCLNMYPIHMNNFLYPIVKIFPEETWVKTQRSCLGYKRGENIKLSCVVKWGNFEVAFSKIAPAILNEYIPDSFKFTKPRTRKDDFSDKIELYLHTIYKAFPNIKQNAGFAFWNLEDVENMWLKNHLKIKIHPLFTGLIR